MTNPVKQLSRVQRATMQANSATADAQTKRAPLATTQHAFKRELVNALSKTPLATTN